MFKISTRLGKPLAALALILVLSGFAALESLFVPKAELWPRWEANDKGSSTIVDHGIWDQFLKRYVMTDKAGLNLVAYGKITEADTKKLHGYLINLRTVSVSRLNRAEQLAYWINLYNALTVRLIAEFYPVASIQDIDIGNGFFSSGPWDKNLIELEGEMLSLNDIEHRILRPIWKDPRIHYAVNCASIGCPNLQNSAFTAARMDHMLDRAASSYINSPRGIKISDGEVTMSKIYSWFQTDFGGSEDRVLNHLKKYADVELRRNLEPVTSISGYAYDWRLNDEAQ